MAIEYRLDLQTKLFEHRVRWGAGLRREGVGETERNRRTRVMQVYEGEMAAAGRDAVSDEDQRTPICVHAGFDHEDLRYAFWAAEDAAKRLLWDCRTRSEQAAGRALHEGTIEEHRATMDAWTCAFDHWAIVAGLMGVRRAAREADRCAA